MSSLLSTALFIAVWMVILGGYIGWLAFSHEQYRPIEITAAQDYSSSLPVYAQFIVTQAVELAEPAKIARIAVPLYLPDQALPLVVKLRQKDNLIHTWLLTEEDFRGETEAWEAVLWLKEPRWLSGRLEVEFEGPTIQVGEKDRAPRVFVESSDESYPAGNYRVAGKEKSGDVAMRFYADKSRWLAARQKFDGGINFGNWLAARAVLAAVVAAVPAKLANEISGWRRRRTKGEIHA